MVESIKLIKTKGADAEQVYPETHADVVHGLTDAISTVAGGHDNKLPDGADLNACTSGSDAGMKVYIIDGVHIKNGPQSVVSTQCWAALVVIDINANTAVQQYYDSNGDVWMRGAGGANKTWNSWKKH
ncbi:pyocin knob domain-containing protein [Limosilactobacillus fermentum]|uniref:pyocin knob domain-containing protein n=1 Tax=Limosilactobacillus fermentum TaxID=1613 RepID=UPI0032664FF9